MPLEGGGLGANEDLRLRCHSRSMHALPRPHFVVEVLMAAETLSSITRTKVKVGGGDMVGHLCSQVGGGDRTVWKPVDQLAQRRRCSGQAWASSAQGSTSPQHQRGGLG